MTIQKRLVFGVFALIAAVLSIHCSGGSDALSAPANVAASVFAPKALSVTWDAAEGATSYNLYYSASAGVTKETGTKLEGVTSPHTLVGLTTGTPYYLVVTSANASGESVLSAEVTATPVFEGVLDTTFAAIDASNIDMTVTPKVASDSQGNVYAYVPAVAAADNSYTSKIYKFKTDGALDTSFAEGGILSMAATADPEPGFFPVSEGCAYSGLDTDSENSLYVTGFCVDSSVHARTWKYTGGGELDLAFGGGSGFVDEQIDDVAIGYDVLAEADGNILVVGLALVEGGSEMFLARYSSAGSRLSIAEEAAVGGHPVYSYVREDASGNIVVSSPISERATPMTWKFLNDAVTLDQGFGSGGVLLSEGYAWIGPPFFDGEGHIYLNPYSEDEEENSLAWVSKLDGTGGAVTAFGAGGTVNTTEICASGDRFVMTAGSTMNSAGTIITVGLLAVSENEVSSLICALDRTTGALDTSLFDGGVAGGVANLYAEIADVDALGRVVAYGLLIDPNALNEGQFIPVGYQAVRYK